MDSEAWIALSIGVATLLLNILAFAIGYGMLKGQVNALDARVKAIENEMSILNTLTTDVARIDERTKSMKEGIDRLSDSWLMMDPPPYRPRGD